MAETITTDDLTTVGHTRKVYDAMRFTPGQILLDEHDCINSVVDTGASLSMVDETFVDACGLTGTLEEIDQTYLMASGQSCRKNPAERTGAIRPV